MSATNNSTTSTASFRLLSGSNQRSASITVQNGTEQKTLFYTVLAYPACKNQQLLVKPIETNVNLPQVVSKTSVEKVDVSSEIVENTEGSNGNGKSNNTSTIKKSIYPNPAKDFLTVEGIGDVDKIQIVDLTGKVLRMVDIEENEVGRTLNVSDLMNGMYILKKIKRDGQLEAAKFQVMH